MSAAAALTTATQAAGQQHKCVNCGKPDGLCQVEINESASMVLCDKCSNCIVRLSAHDASAEACCKCRKQCAIMVKDRMPTATIHKPRCVNCLLSREVQTPFVEPVREPTPAAVLKKVSVHEVSATATVAKDAAAIQRRTAELQEAQRILDESFAHIVGMGAVKEQLIKLFKRLVADDIDRARGRKIAQRMPHFVLKGNPGTGKNTVARAIQRMLLATKVVKGNVFYEIKAASLTAGFVGQTKDHVASEVEKAAGGVLFVDEAHELANTSGPKAVPRDQFSGEAFNGLMHAMGDEGTKAKCAMIFAGYPAEMEKFARDLNPGFQRRITGGVFTLPDFDAKGLNAVLKSQMEAQGRRLDDEAQWSNIEAAWGKIPDSVRQKHNAGLVGQVVDAVRDRLLGRFELGQLAELDDELDVFPAADVIEMIGEVAKNHTSQPPAH